MRKIIFVILSAVLLVTVLAGCAKTPDWENVTKDTVVATVEGEEFKYDLLKYFYYEKTVSAEITKELNVEIDDQEIEVDEESFTRDDALNRLLCLAALSAVRQKEGNAWNRQEAYDYTVDTLTGSVEQYPYMQSYLDMMCEKLELTPDELIKVAADELRLLMDADEVAKEVLTEALTETGSKDITVLSKKAAEKLANKARTVSVTNNMTGQKRYMPDFSDYAREIVYLYINNAAE